MQAKAVSFIGVITLLAVKIPESDAVLPNLCNPGVPQPRYPSYATAPRRGAIGLKQGLIGAAGDKQLKLKKDLLTAKTLGGASYPLGARPVPYPLGAGVGQYYQPPGFPYATSPLLNPLPATLSNPLLLKWLTGLCSLVPGATPTGVPGPRVQWNANTNANANNNQEVIIVNHDHFLHK